MKEIEVVVNLRMRRYYLVETVSRKKALAEAKKMLNEEWAEMSEKLQNEYGFILEEGADMEVTYIGG